VASVLVDQGLSSVAPLIRALQDDRYDRQAIVDALSDAGPAVVDPLSELLLQPAPGVAAAAATSLGSLGESALPAVSRLVLALRRTEPEIIAAAAGALGRIAPDRNDVLPALLQVARAPDGEDGPDTPLAHAHAAAREAAVRGLLLRMASTQTPLQEQALAEMAALGSLAAEGLIHALKFEDETLAGEAASCLAALGPEALPHVIGSLGERNPTHVARGALVVSRLGPPALAPLLAIINDPGNRDRVRATTAIVGLGADAAPAWPALLALLDDPVPQLPIAAALTLGKLTPPDDASLAALVAARQRSSAMVGRLLVPALVRGLLPRTEPGAPQARRAADAAPRAGPRRPVRARAAARGRRPGARSGRRPRGRAAVLALIGASTAGRPGLPRWGYHQGRRNSASSSPATSLPRALKCVSRSW
jgi:hypothetical protein